MDENDPDNDRSYGSAHSRSNADNNSDSSQSSSPESLHRKFANKFSGHYFYALLTGFQSVDAVGFYKRMFPYYLSQNISTFDDKETKTDKIQECHENLLVGAFEYLENTYESNLSEQLTEKALLDIELQEKKAEEYPELNNNLIKLTRSLSSGLSCALALIYKQTLYVANTGDTRAFLAKQVLTSNGNSILKAISLASVHTIDNNQELAFLSKSKIDVQTVKSNGKIGNMRLTRCLGNFYMKKFYKEFPEFKQTVIDLPIKWEPSLEIFPLDEKCQFLILASSSVMDLIECIIEAKSKTITQQETSSSSSSTPVPSPASTPSSSSSPSSSSPAGENDDPITASKMLVDIANKFYQTDIPMKSVAQKTLQELLQIFRAHSGRDLFKNVELSLIIRDLGPEFGHVRQEVELSSELEKQLHIDIDSKPIDRDVSDFHDDVDFNKNNNRSIVSPFDSFPHPPCDLASNEEIEPYVDFTDLLEAYNEI